MMRNHIILFGVFVSHFSVILSATLGSDNSLGIIDGYVAKDGEFPYQVLFRLKSQDSNLWGGAIINKNHVITSAYIGISLRLLGYKNFNLVSGINKLNDTKHLVIKEIESIKIHERFSIFSAQNDISIIKIKGEFTYSRYLKPIDINPEHIPEGANCTISGWGALNPDEPYKYGNELRGSHVQILNQTQCVANYSNVYLTVDPKTMVCAGVPGKSTGPGAGDFGGPMECNNKLTGLISWEHTFHTQNYPTIFTRVGHFVDWIKKNSNTSDTHKEDLRST